MFINYVKSKSHHRVDRYTVWGLKKKTSTDNWKDFLTDSEASDNEENEEVENEIEE